MIRTVRNDQVIPLGHFPYKAEQVRENPDLLRRFLFVPLDPTLTDDDHCMVMDYDGFVEWFPVWNHMYEEENDGDWYKDNEGAEYLLDSIFRTVDVVKGVIE